MYLSQARAEELNTCSFWGGSFYFEVAIPWTSRLLARCLFCAWLCWIGFRGNRLHQQFYWISCFVLHFVLSFFFLVAMPWDIYIRLMSKYKYAQTILCLSLNNILKWCNIYEYWNITTCVLVTCVLSYLLYSNGCCNIFSQIKKRHKATEMVSYNKGKESQIFV